MNIEKKINKANRKLARVIMWLQENKKKFEYTNYKMYDAFFYDYQKDFPLATQAYDYDTESLFHQWCDDSFRQFEEWIDMEGLDYKPEYLGRTSSFKVHKDAVLDRYDDLDIPGTIDNLINTLFYGGYGSWVALTRIGLIDKVTTLEVAKDYPDEVETDLDYIIKNFFKDVKAHFEDAIRVRNYIDDTKENQVEYFKEWLQYYEDEQEHEKEQEYKENQVEYISRIAWLKTFSPEKEEVLENTYLPSETLQRLALAH